jgi:hypothetical protein
MLVQGILEYEDRQFEFLYVFQEFSPEYCMIQYEGKSYNLKFLASRFKFITAFRAFEDYFESGMMRMHVKKVLDGNEKQYYFKYFDILVSMELAHINEKEDYVIGKITELIPTYDSETGLFLIDAHIGNKIVHFLEEEDLTFFFKYAKIRLGYYSGEKLDELISCVGTYLDITFGRKNVLEHYQMTSPSCMKVFPEKTLENFTNTGAFEITSYGMVDTAVREKMYYNIKNILNDIVSENLLNDLAEY